MSAKHPCRDPPRSASRAQSHAVAHAPPTPSVLSTPAPVAVAVSQSTSTLPSAAPRPHRRVTKIHASSSVRHQPDYPLSSPPSPSCFPLRTDRNNPHRVTAWTRQEHRGIRSASDWYLNLHSEEDGFWGAKITDDKPVDPWKTPTEIMLERQRTREEHWRKGWGDGALQNEWREHGCGLNYQMKTAPVSGSASAGQGEKGNTVGKRGGSDGEIDTHQESGKDWEGLWLEK